MPNFPWNCQRLNERLCAMHTVGTQYLLNHMSCHLGKCSVLCKQANCPSKCDKHPGHLSHEAGESRWSTKPHVQCGKSYSTSVSHGWKNMSIYKSQHISIDFFPQLHLEMQQLFNFFKIHLLVWKLATDHSKTIVFLILRKSLSVEVTLKKPMQRRNLYLIFLTVLINFKYMIGNLFWSQRFAENVRELS